MRVNASKLELLTNSAAVCDALLTARELRGAMRQATRNLGVDYACGGRVGLGVRRQRQRRALVRMPFLKRLRHAGARVVRLVQSAVVPMLVYGAGVIGMPPSQMAQARRLAHSLCRRTARGRSQAAAMALEPRGGLTLGGEARLTASSRGWLP